MKRIITLLIMTLLSLKVATVSASPINIGEEELLENSFDSLNIDDYDSIKSTLTLYKVPESQQKILFNKLLTGEQWDSLKESTKPITVSQMIINGVIESVERYNDGSIAVTSVDLEYAKKLDSDILFDTSQIESNTKIAPNAISIGEVEKTSHSTTYTNAKVYHNTVLVNASFYANFTLVRTGYGRINSVYNPKVLVLGPGASVSNRKLVINRRNQTASNSAMATLTFDYKTNFTSSNAYLRLLVGRNYSTNYYY